MVSLDDSEFFGLRASGDIEAMIRRHRTIN
jgi:hypothetical protein